MNNLLKIARELDEKDQLRNIRQQFVYPENTVYLDGNSLGLLLKNSQSYLSKVIEHQWGQRLIRSWNENWYSLQEDLGNELGKFLGAEKGEIILSDSTSVNIFKLSVALLKDKTEGTILVDDLNFPTDIYLQEGIVQLLNRHKLDLLPSENGIISIQQIQKRLQQGDVRLLVLSHVAFKSGYCYPLEEINTIAEEMNVPVLWDFSHSAGVVPIHLSESNTKFAVGCTYKYLNGGPGSPAFIYIKKEEQDQLLSPIWGWFGDKQPFELRTSYQPGKNIRQFLVGTPPVLSLTALKPSFDLINSVSIGDIRNKSVALSEFFIELFNQHLKKYHFELHSPIQPELRGSHIILSHPKAEQIIQALISDKTGNTVVIPDFRKPDFIRFGFAPLYNSFTDIAICIQEIVSILRSKSYEQFSTDLKGVT